MTQAEIENCICELLFEHDCVVLPNFGAFIGNFRSARFSVFGHKLYPPSKEITFNPSLYKNDGLVVASLAHEHSTSYEQAHEALAGYVDGIKQALVSAGRFTLPGVGRFVKEGSKTYFFQDDSKNYLLASWGLRPIVVRPLYSDSSDTKVVTKVKEVSVVQPQSTTTSGASLWRVAAVIIPLIALTILMLLLNPWSQSKHIEMAGFTVEECALYKPVKSTLLPVEFDYLRSHKVDMEGFSSRHVLAKELFHELTTAFNHELIVALPYQKHLADSTHVASYVPRNIKLNEYMVVVGCFAELDNATNLVHKMRDFGYAGAQIIDRFKGLHRVGIAAGYSRQEAELLRDKVKQEIQPESWLARK